MSLSSHGDFHKICCYSVRFYKPLSPYEHSNLLINMFIELEKKEKAKGKSQTVISLFRIPLCRNSFTHSLNCRLNHKLSRCRSRFCYIRKSAAHLMKIVFNLFDVFTIEAYPACYIQKDLRKSLNILIL